MPIPRSSLCPRCQEFPIRKLPLKSRVGVVAAALFGGQYSALKFGYPRTCSVMEPQFAETSRNTAHVDERWPEHTGIAACLLRPPGSTFSTPTSRSRYISSVYEPTFSASRLSPYILSGMRSSSSSLVNSRWKKIECHSCVSERRTNERRR
jgi:hypothetical protein